MCFVLKILHHIIIYTNIFFYVLCEQIDYFQTSSSAFSVNLGRILIHCLCY